MEHVLERAKEAQASRMPGKADVERPTRVDDEAGGTTTTFTKLSEGIKFRLMAGPANQAAMDQEIVDRLGSRLPFYATIETGNSLDSGDRIAQYEPVERLFEIVAVLNRHTAYETATRLIVAEWV